MLAAVPRDHGLLARIRPVDAGRVHGDRVGEDLTRREGDRRPSAACKLHHGAVGVRVGEKPPSVAQGLAERELRYGSQRDGILSVKRGTGGERALRGRHCELGERGLGFSKGGVAGDDARAALVVGGDHAPAPQQREDAPGRVVGVREAGKRVEREFAVCVSREHAIQRDFMEMWIERTDTLSSRTRACPGVAKCSIRARADQGARHVSRCTVRGARWAGTTSSRRLRRSSSRKTCTSPGRTVRPHP